MYVYGYAYVDVGVDVDVMFYGDVIVNGGMGVDINGDVKLGVDVYMSVYVNVGCVCSY